VRILSWWVWRNEEASSWIWIFFACLMEIPKFCNKIAKSCPLWFIIFSFWFLSNFILINFSIISIRTSFFWYSVSYCQWKKTKIKNFFPPLEMKWHYSKNYHLYDCFRRSWNYTVGNPTILADTNKENNKMLLFFCLSSHIQSLGK
jgi:predicted membrane protein